MFVESNADSEKDPLLISHTSDEHQATEYTWSHDSAGCDLPSISSDQQNQVAVVQALMDLNASTHISYPSTDACSQQKCAFGVPQKFERKSCNCAKSHCLKLYCECFAKGQSCDGCNCSNLCITSEVIEVACSCMLSQLLMASHHNMSDTDQEQVVLAEFAKCLNHILDSVNKLRNARISVRNYGQDVSALSPSGIARVVEKSVACVYPSYPLASVPYTVSSEFPMSLPHSAGNIPDITSQGVVSTDQAYVDYSNVGSIGAFAIFSQFPVSSEMSEDSLSQYGPNYSSFQAVLSPGAGDPSNVVEISDITETIKADPNAPTILVPYGMLSSGLSELHGHFLPVLSSPSPPHQPAAYPLGRQSFLMPSSTGTVLSEDTICYPLTYSTEADLAAAAISAEVDPTLATDRTEFCDYANNVDANGGCDCAGESDECFHPNALDLAYYSLSTPFDLIPAKF
ncbi:unnamed protein product [Taenia asiatica]|uniref:CRC domain-containing protein n=1 Tax=Taenia asiatica TaxID=60517 RepID=A0A0R3VV68_TAEAS|nr:unnamed protein product [Taenia asiatica]